MIPENGIECVMESDAENSLSAFVWINTRVRVDIQRTKKMVNF